MRYLILALMLSSCAVTQPMAKFSPSEIDQAWHIFGCRTSCGLYAPTARDCPALEHLEDATLRAYDRHVKGWTVERMCGALQGWTVVIAPRVDLDDAWLPYVQGEPAPLRLYGLTMPSERLVMVGTHEWNRSALTHELGHVFDVVLDKREGGHFGWAKRGLCAAINEVTALKDDCSDPDYQ